MTYLSRAPTLSCAQGSLGGKKFTIEMMDSMSHNDLPRAHTCFNRIDLPRYRSYQALDAKLQLAIENTMGFGIE